MENEDTNYWGFMLIGFTIFGLAEIISWLLS